MDNSRLVSVIIPVYNVEQYLRECIESVLGQTYANWEMILVDDGAKDSSGKICDEYAEIDERIRAIHQKNGGLSVARNTGFVNAKGEYVYFLDSDDWILPETLFELVNKAEQEEAEVVFFDAWSFLDGDEKREIAQRYIRIHDYPTENGYKVLGILQNNKEYHSAVPLLFMKRKFVEKNNLSFLPDVLYEDMLFTYQVYCKSDKVAYLHKAYYQRRYRSESIMMSKKTMRNFISAKKIYLELRAFSEKEGKIDSFISEIYISRCAFNALNLYRCLSSEERKECKQNYKLLKKDILEYNAYGNKALYMRCYGVLPWFCYKMCERALAYLKGKK